MEEKKGTSRVFHFVPVDASKAQRRRLVRSNAANYQWSRQKKMIGNIHERNKRERAKTREDGALNAACIQSTADELARADGIGGFDSKSGALVLGYKDRERLVPRLATYADLIILPENGIGPLMKFNISYIVPNLIPEIANGIENPAAPFFIQLAAQSPALYITWMHCAMIFYDNLRNEPDECLEHKIATQSLAVSLLNEQMLDPTTACSDQNLLAVLGLAAHGQDAIPAGQKLPQQGPLRDLQGMELYSSMKSVPLHLNGLALLVQMRGGLEEVKTPGVAAIISYMGILEAIKTLKIPRWPFIPLGQALRPLENMTTTFQPNHPLRNIGTGFPFGTETSTSEPLSQLYSVVQAICAYTVVIYNHCEGRGLQHSLCAIADQRNCVQHKLMSLPENSIAQPAVDDDGVYEAVRLATIIFSLLVVFPASAAAVPFIGLAARLQRQLSYMNTSKATYEELSVFVWMLFMGGIASVGSDEQSWFVSTLTVVCTRIDVHVWVDVQELLRSFLWLPSTNDTDGLELWADSNRLRS